MASWMLLEIADFLYKWSSPFFALITLVFGILIMVGKNKNLKLLGLGFVLGLGVTITSFINIYIPNLYNAGVLNEDFFRSGNYITVKMMLGLTSFAFTLVAMTLRWLYTRRANGTGIGVLITIYVLMVLGPVARVITNKILLDILPRSEEPELLSVYMGTVSLVVSGALTAVFVYVFFKNRKKEKYIPSYWVFLLLFIIADIISHLIMIGKVNNMDNENYALFGITVNLLLGVILPVSAVYLFIGSRKSAGNVEN